MVDTSRTAGPSNTGPTSRNTGANGPSSANQNQMGGTGSDLFAASASMGKGGMRGIGLIAAIVSEIVLKEKVIDIARDYYNTNKRDYDFFAGVHMPRMAESATEAFGPRSIDVAVDKYASVPSGIVKSSILDKQWFEARRRIPKYNTGQQRRLDYDMAVMRTHGVAAGWNIATRYEMAWADERNERNFKRKIEVANVGISVGNVIKEGMARATQGLASAYDNIGDTIASIGNGYSANSGYKAGQEYAKGQYNKNQLPSSMK